MVTKPIKAATSITQQIDLLRSRGMHVDGALAEQWLSNVSYYRLSAYWYPARLTNQHGKRSDNFVSGTDFSDVVELYEADRKLRTLIHDGMERIEVAMRARIGEQLYPDGPLQYTDPVRFRPNFDHGKWMKTAQKRIARAQRHNEAIKHHLTEYEGKFPFWVLADVLDFSDISRLFEGLPSQDQREIAEGLNIWINMDALSKEQQRKVKRESPLVRWMEQLTIVRNTCAHHGRLWNKSFSPAPTTALRTQEVFGYLPEGQSERIFGTLTVMAHLLQTISPGTAWSQKVVDLLEACFLPNGLVSAASLGIPENWDRQL